MIRVACADDHSTIRRGLAALIGGEPDMEIVGEACDGDAAIALADRTRIDVMVMDMRMPGMDPMVVIAELSTRDPPVRVVVFTTFSSGDTVLRAIRAGAHGYLTKTCHDGELLSAVRRVSGGGRAYPEEIASQLAAAMVAPVLTAREFDVLAGLAQGASNKDMARKLGISPGTVKVHVQHVLEKLGCIDRTGAVVEGQRRGLIDVTR